MNIKRNFQKIKNIYHFSKAVLANVWFGFPSKKMTVIGVTGTNGKTTTTLMIAKILEATDKKVAVYSTINFRIGKEEQVNKTKFTTQSAWKLQKFIKKAVRENCHYLVLETSSHALDQFRVWGVDYDVAVITNITREHLDYHFNMDEYRQAKLKLFEITTKTAEKGQKIGVINADMENFQDFVSLEMSRNYLYGVKSDKEKLAENNLFLRPEKIKLENFKSQFELNRVKFELNLPGIFNIENALASICVGISQGISLKKISEKLKEIKNVPGRMEFIENKKGLNIIVDYALTPDSMEKLGELMSDFKEKNKAKLIWVFGSCGDRDRGKRPLMGEIVEKFADLIITTNEDPYTEDPIKIIEEIEKGIKNKKNLMRIVDRKKALKKALKEAKKGDVVLVTGKGAEENIMVGSCKIPWNDKKVIQEILKVL